MESLNRIVIKKHEINRAFFVLNLILDGWLLILYSICGWIYPLQTSFKPCFRWLAPYTLVF